MRRKALPEEETPVVSKTRQKQAMQDLQSLGAELLELSRDQMKRIGLPEELYEAVLEWHRFTKHEAKRRQLQYIGKLMRGLDPEPIAAGLALLRGESAAETARLHRLERLREELLADESTLQRIAETWPEADLGQLRTLRRNTLKEKEAARPPRNYRALFQALKALESSDHAPAKEAPDDE